MTNCGHFYYRIDTTGMSLINTYIYEYMNTTYKLFLIGLNERTRKVKFSVRISGNQNIQIVLLTFRKKILARGKSQTSFSKVIHMGFSPKSAI